MRFTLSLLLLLLASPLTAQQSKFRVGLFGFAAQAGIDFSDDDQAVFGTTLDLGDLYGERLRMRGGAELGIGSAANTIVATRKQK